MPQLPTKPKCPKCGEILDGYTGDILPYPGAIVVCFYCETPCRYLEGLARLEVLDTACVDRSMRQQIEQAVGVIRQTNTKLGRKRR